ncbi:hypothetical protein FA95DRAFT_1516785 [Auriscalpium vulgare]|uniref:Uncharacterized protein n=1 Tax=Auriscalpium vulgare TaxID=40419 RepID=A0ACB8RY97_9AGAM|nr:hypothetical protein FA95DRAFT_1516785 [Auriscalpium vulgare]
MDSSRLSNVMDTVQDPQIDPALQNLPAPVREPEPQGTPRPPSVAAEPPHPPVGSIDDPANAEYSGGAETLQAMADGQGPPGERQLNVTDALSYLDAVKSQFHERPDVYNSFLDIMKDFKHQTIDTPQVIHRVSCLFHGHPMLIQGFNTFLPVGYRIEVTTDPSSSDVITVTTPGGTVLSSTIDAYQAPPPREPLTLEPIKRSSQQPNSPPLQRPPPDRSPSPLVQLDTAMDYVQRIKTRFHDDPDTYKKFLEILTSQNPRNPSSHAEALAKVEELFKDAPDLSSAFRDFLPDNRQGGSAIQGMLQGQGHTRTATPTHMEHSRAQKRKQPAPDPIAPPSAAPAKRRRKAGPERDVKEKEKDARSKTKKLKPHGDASPSFAHYNTLAAPPSPRRSGHHYSHHPPPGALNMQIYQAPVPPHQLALSDDSQFFARVKQALDVRETYHEFLRLVNLFTQDFIDRARLIRMSRTFLQDGALMAQFKDILGWDESMEHAALARERDEAFLPPGRPMMILDRPSKEELNIRHGSYRRLPANETNVQCSGRDDMCRSVLNDEWISHPAFDAEDAVFIAHKKNIYEEALHRSEEERHEYDFHIDALMRTIALLEPIAAKMSAMGPDERGNFKLKPNFGGAGKAVHQRIIKKLYGREPGLDVIQALQETPAQAIPVVLVRLKQKEAEWKRAQRAWNSVWRAVDAQNYARALDHQAIAFRAADKKGLTSKAFVGQIEAAMEAHVARRAMLIDPGFARARPAHHLAHVLEDADVLRDAVKLVFSFLARVAGSQMRLDAPRRTWVETRLYNIVVAFFGLGDGWAPPMGEAGEAITSKKAVDAARRTKKPAEAEGSEEMVKAGRSGLGSTFVGDLRKNLLKSEQAKSTRAQARPSAPASPSPMASRTASPVPVPMVLDEESRDVSPVVAAPGFGLEKTLSRRRSFFTSTWFYSFLRMFEVLYSRLALLKAIAAERAGASSSKTTESENSEPQEAVSPTEYYEFMLESCERLFDNQIEQGAFEDQMREMFGLHDAYKIFTVDKVVGAIIKHVQSWEQDAKLDKLMKLLWEERRLEHPTVEDHRKLRRQAEEILGPEENLFRIDWLPESKTMTCQLLSKDGSSLDDAELLSGRWQSYVDSFVSDRETEGIPPSKVRRPFLRRSLPVPLTPISPVVRARGELQIKVCVRTYRLFFVSRSEDVLWRVRPDEEVERAETALRDINARRLKRLQEKLKQMAPVEADE